MEGGIWLWCHCLKLDQQVFPLPNKGCISGTGPSNLLFQETYGYPDDKPTETESKE